MTIEQAKDYINSGINEGYFSPEQFEEMSDQELIKFAEYEGAKGDYYANELRDEE